MIGARFAAERSGVSDFISLDMGGTSNDVSVVHGGQPAVTAEGRIGPYPVRTPMVDVNTIGAGGGSLAWIDAGGGLRVGPQSAGAEPGPACYGRGGDRPTVTDASVLLGYLNPENFAGGSLRLDVRAAERAVATVAGPLRLDTVATAAGIHRVVNARMADQIRLMTIQRGHDPRGFTLVLLGGAGPVHGVALAEELGLADVLVPEAPGVLSALGLLAASVEHEHARTHPTLVEAADLAAVNGVFRDCDTAGRARMREEPCPPLRWRSLSATCATSARRTSYPSRSRRRSSPRALAAAQTAFHAIHERVYGYARTGQAVEFVNLRAVHTYRPAGPADPAAGADAGRSRRAPGSVSAGFTSRRPASRQRRCTRVLACRSAPMCRVRRSSSRRTRPPWCRRAGRCSSRNPATFASGATGGAEPWPTRTVDPILLEVVRNRLETIADEMELTLLKSATSPIVKEGLDASAALFNVRGETIAQAAAIPIHLGCLELAARRIVRAFPPETMTEGDAFLLNDPYDGGTHLPDITLAVPVVAEGRVVRAGVHDVPPPGRRGPDAGERADGRHRALPGRGDHPADPVVSRGRAGREPVRPPPAQRAHSGRVHRRPDGPGGGRSAWRDPAQRAVRALRDRRRAGVHRRAARSARRSSPGAASRRFPTAPTPSRTGWTTTGSRTGRSGSRWR